MPEARAGFALVAICLLAPAASAQEPARSSAAEVFHTDDPRNWGSPKRVLPPEYPAEALARRHTGYVDFQGVVTAVENIEPGKFEPDSAASAIFIEPLKRVLPH